MDTIPGVLEFNIKHGGKYIREPRLASSAPKIYSI
jgi:hypothetical protein